MVVVWRTSKLTYLQYVQKEQATGWQDHTIGSLTNALSVLVPLDQRRRVTFGLAVQCGRFVATNYHIGRLFDDGRRSCLQQITGVHSTAKGEQTSDQYNNPLAGSNRFKGVQRQVAYQVNPGVVLRLKKAMCENEWPPVPVQQRRLHFESNPVRNGIGCVGSNDAQTLKGRR